MKFKEMDPADVLKAIEGHEDVLGPEAKKMSAFYDSFKCPRCRCALQKEVSPNHVFNDPNSVLPRSLLRCTNCRYLIDPHSNIVVETGDPSKMPVESIPIINPEG